MRALFLSVFWITTVGNFLQFLVIIYAGAIVLSGAYSFSDLSVNVFITQFLPWFSWLKVVIISLLGEFGRWVLEVPVLAISPLKFAGGAVIGLWAYSRAQEYPNGHSIQ